LAEIISSNAVELAQAIFLEYGDILVHRTRRYVFRQGEVVKLRTLQFNLLVVFMLNQEKTFSSRALYLAADGRQQSEKFDPTANVAVEISQLRKKLGNPYIIRNISGKGYQFESKERVRFFSTPLPAVSPAP
jgi:two-component system, OmpR family, response regulator VanR